LVGVNPLKLEGILVVHWKTSSQGCVSTPVNTLSVLQLGSESWHSVALSPVDSETQQNMFLIKKQQQRTHVTACVAFTEKDECTWVQ